VTVSPDKLYDELCQAWRLFVSWRDKIFAGYLSVLAVLAYAISQYPSTLFRVVGFSFVILFSLVFRILDFRTNEFINSCQLAGDMMEGSTGFCAEINRRRYGKPSEETVVDLPKDSWVNFTTAINLLVVFVVGISLAGLIFYLLEWSLVNVGFRCWPILAIVPTVGVAVGVALVVILWKLQRKQGKEVWDKDRTEYFDRVLKKGNK